MGKKQTKIYQSIQFKLMNILYFQKISTYQISINPYPMFIIKEVTPDNKHRRNTLMKVLVITTLVFVMLKSITHAIPYAYITNHWYEYSKIEKSN